MKTSSVRSSAIGLFATSSSPCPSTAIGACNAVAARVAAEAGFDAIWVSGLEVSAARGLPDTNVIGVRDLVDVVQVVGGVSGLPTIVDIDNAGGSVDQARRYGRELAQAGASAVSLEDSAYPKCNSFSTHTRQALARSDLYLAQLEALRSSGGELLIIVARTEALICDAGLDAALERAHAYASAGADAVIIHSRDRTGAEAMRVADAWQGSRTPLISIPTAFPQFSAPELGRRGYRLVIFPNQLSRLALAAMRRGVSEYLETGVFGQGSEMASIQDLLKIGAHEATADL